MKKVTYNAHPKLIKKGFQEKVKQTKEKIIGNQDSADCFNRALKFLKKKPPLEYPTFGGVEKH